MSEFMIYLIEFDFITSIMNILLLEILNFKVIFGTIIITRLYNSYFSEFQIAFLDHNNIIIFNCVIILKFYKDEKLKRKCTCMAQ